MSNVTKLHLALILLLAFSLFGLAAELLYLLHCRRRRRRCLRRQSLGLAVDPELQEDSGADNNNSVSSKWTLLRALCFKKQPSSRVEPALAAAAASPATKTAAVGALAERDTVEATAEEEDEEECDLMRWREMCLGPSRALYTIQEEEDAGHSVAGGDQEARHADDDDCDCGSDSGGTPFYTPASSPPRASEEAGKVPPAGERREV